MTTTLRTSRRLAAIAAAALLLPAAYAQPKVMLKFNLSTPPGNPYNVGADVFKKDGRGRYAGRGDGADLSDGAARRRD